GSSGAAGGGGTSSGFSFSFGGINTAGKPLEVRMETVATGDLVRSISAPGAVEPRTKVQISAQVLAKILALPFREGETVRKGDVLVRLDGRDLAASLESAQASLRGQEANLKGAEADEIQARLELERVRSLFPRDVTRSALESAEANALRAESRVLSQRAAITQAQAAITRAQKDLENTTITSPIDGVIVKLNAEVGETVVVGTLNNASSVIMEVADLSDMLMRARVDEVNIAPVAPGQRARVMLAAFPTRELLGTVERVGLKQQLFRDGTSYFDVEIALGKPEGLRLGSGLTASAEIEVQTFTSIIKIPTQAVLDRRVDELPKDVADSPLVDRNKTVTRLVAVVDSEGAVRFTPVRVGASDLTSTIITDGLKTGDKIVTGPFRALGELRHELKVVDEGTKDAEGNPVGRKPGGSSNSFSPPRPR
ncbi:MAG: efflux RND transporter periplasmic adaptor subunit, partial [Phycisphaerales bacterium]|nr:efflux RND transporter periplasmic adaptor subunit [Phycisphaerales bacterium]